MKKIYLGSDDIIEEMQSKIDPDQSLVGIPKSNRRPNRWIIISLCIQNAMKLWREYLSGDCTLQKTGEYFDVSYSTVSRTVRTLE